MEERTFCKTIYAVLCCLLLSTSLFAQKQKVDTTHIYSIPEITVSDPYQTREVRSTTPEQIFSKEELKNLHVLQVSDAVKHFAGVTVKDYGGIGGLKTVSIRSLGAQHTAVAYDGITISDCQTGQIDIGRFSLNNVDRLSLHNGQGDNIFTCPYLCLRRIIEHTNTHSVFLCPQADQYGSRIQNRFMGLSKPFSLTGTTTH